MTFPAMWMRGLVGLLLAVMAWAGCSSCVDRATPPRGSNAPRPSDDDQVREFAEKRQAPAAEQPAKKVVRRPAVAGSWYPRDPAELGRSLDAMLADAPEVKARGQVMALVSPHAGYAYSGKAAAAGFKLLAGRKVRRVVVLAVSHRVPFDGASIAPVTHYATPLGEIPLDRAAVKRLRRHALVGEVPEAHAQEHSLEMQLPLLQRVLGSFELVPVLLGRMGEGDHARLAEALMEVVGPDTVVVASSDFTHRGPNYSYEVPEGKGTVKERLARVDQGSVRHLLAMDPAGLLAHQRKTGSTICGLGPVATLLSMLTQVKGVAPALAAHYTSGDVSGDWTNTVTYIDVAYAGTWPAGAGAGGVKAAAGGGVTGFALSAGDRAVLLKLARDALEASVRRGAYDPAPLSRLGSSPSLSRKAGAFVTLKCKMGSQHTCVGRGHDLRGCIGTIAPVAPVAETVAARAASAALDDPRFPRKVGVDELRHVGVEVSVLTPPREVAGPDAIVIGRHGIILSNGGRSATFLPQVAPEQGWDLETTLEHLARKAGLAADGYKDQRTSFQVYEAIVLKEPD